MFTLDEKQEVNMLTKQWFNMPILNHAHWKMFATSIGDIEGEPLVFEATSEEYADVPAMLTCLSDLSNEDRLAHFILFEDIKTNEQFMTLKLPRNMTRKERRSTVSNAKKYIKKKLGIEVTGIKVHL